MKYAVNPFAPRCRRCFPLIFAATLLQLKYSYPGSKVLTSALFPRGHLHLRLCLLFTPFAEANARAVCCNFAVRFSPACLNVVLIVVVVVDVVSARWCVLLSQIKRNHCCGTRFLLPIPPTFQPLSTLLQPLEEARASTAFFMSGFRSCGSLKYCK